MTNRELFGTPVAGYLSNHAFFDGIYINTDSLGDCRVDRVIPIMEEGQIFMCRQMKQTINRLKKEKGAGLQVLDVGTGSGVLGIYAERILNEGIDDNLSTVQLLDKSQRALDRAKLNCEINHSKGCEILEDV
jgi:ubiquinone/menaquinone biosynthesis C-methylase UbiE